VHRGGVLAAILIAALVGLSLLSGLIAYLADPVNFDFRSPQEAGKMFTAGRLAWKLWCWSWRLQPHFAGAGQRAQSRPVGQQPFDAAPAVAAVTGYWFGPPLREFYMAVVLAGTGLGIVLLGRLSPALWLGTRF